MRSVFKFLIIASIALTAAGGPSAAFEQIGWRDLTVAIEPGEDPYFGLTFEQRQAFERLLAIARVRKMNPFLSKMTDREKDLVAKLARSGIDAAELTRKEATLRRKIALQRSTVREDRDGTDIKIPGYLLPLGNNEDPKAEFLLVPYAGACIHTPPPPANQIIHVVLDAGFRTHNLFTPVWVSGRLAINRTRHSVGLSDGVSSFDVAYRLKANRIEHYAR